MTLLYRFLASDLPISITLWLLLGLWAVRNRSTLHDVLNDSHPAGTWLGRITVGITVGLPLWVLVADNWRQLLGYGIEARRRWMSDPFESPITPETVRLFTLGLILASVVGVATLYVRHYGGIGLPIGVLILGTGYTYFANPIRMRLDAFLWQTTVNGLDSNVVDIAFTLFWASGVYAFIATVLMAAYLTFCSIVAIPSRLVLGLIHRGRPLREADVFVTYRLRAAAHRQAQGSTSRGEGRAKPDGDTSAR